MLNKKKIRKKKLNKMFQLDTRQCIKYYKTKKKKQKI